MLQICTSGVSPSSRFCCGANCHSVRQKKSQPPCPQGRRPLVLSAVGTTSVLKRWCPARGVNGSFSRPLCDSHLANASRIILVDSDNHDMAVNAARVETGQLDRVRFHNLSAFDTLEAASLVGLNCQR